MADGTTARGARIEPLDRDQLRARIELADVTPGSLVAPHVRAAIHAGHVGQVTILCDRCGTEDTWDYIGETREIRFAAARRHLAGAGWSITDAHDLCPTCGPEVAR